MLEALSFTKIKRGKPFKIGLIRYLSKGVKKINILKKDTGSITIISFDEGEVQGEQSSPFDTFIQIIDGTAEIIIDKKVHQVGSGEAVVVPAHSQNTIVARVKFKMIVTVIKSGITIGR